MNKINIGKSVFQKQIPTLLGLGVLIVALVAGLVFFGQGTGVFAPRATPQTTPKNVRVTNVTDKSFTVSFFTDEVTPGFVKYGDAQNAIKSQMSDDRDQLSGVIGSYNLHHITVSGLESNKEYYYLLGTGSGAEFDSEGKPFKIKTATKLTTPPPASKTIYGAVTNPGGTPAEGGVVYISLDAVGDMSSLIKSSGSWAISLANARSKDGSGYAKIDDNSKFSIFVQGIKFEDKSTTTANIAMAQPLADIILGKNISPAIKENELAQKEEPKIISDGSGMASESAGIDETLQKDKIATESQKIVPPIAEDSIKSGGLTDLVDGEGVSTASTTVDLEELVKTDETAEKVVTNSNPEIVGKALPMTEVKISVHSDNQIEQTVITDENGNFVLDLAEIGATLEPGEHTVTYSYWDPNLGQLVEKTHTFMVEDTSNLLALAPTASPTSTPASTKTTSSTGSETTSISPTPTTMPYGSGNPYSPTATPTKIPTASSSSIATGSSATRSAIVSTESSVMRAGSAGTTMLLALGGLFFIFTGVWSWWLAGEVKEEDNG